MRIAHLWSVVSPIMPMMPDAADARRRAVLARKTQGGMPAPGDEGEGEGEGAVEQWRR